MKKLHNKFFLNPVSLARKETYKAWATGLLIEKVDGDITFKEFPFHRTQECTRAHVDGFLNDLEQLTHAERSELATLWGQNEMLTFIQQVIENVTAAA